MARQHSTDRVPIDGFKKPARLRELLNESKRIRWSAATAIDVRMRLEEDPVVDLRLQNRLIDNAPLPASLHVRKEVRDVVGMETDAAVGGTAIDASWRRRAWSPMAEKLSRMKNWPSGFSGPGATIVRTGCPLRLISS